MRTPPLPGAEKKYILCLLESEFSDPTSNSVIFFFKKRSLLNSNILLRFMGGCVSASIPTSFEL